MEILYPFLELLHADTQTDRKTDRQTHRQKEDNKPFCANFFLRTHQQLRQKLYYIKLIKMVLCNFRKWTYCGLC
jgi:hypothetical protein